MERIAFEQQARTWRQKALSVCISYGAGKDEAEDIAQDVMLRLWQMHDELEKPSATKTFRDVGRDHDHQSEYQSTRRVGDERRRCMADNKTPAAAYHATYLIIYATSGTAE